MPEDANGSANKSANKSANESENENKTDLFAKMALERGFVSPAQMDDARATQRNLL
mgnify:CR=1 FL=1